MDTAMISSQTVCISDFSISERNGMSSSERADKVGMERVGRNGPLGAVFSQNSYVNWTPDLQKMRIISPPKHVPRDTSQLQAHTSQLQAPAPASDEKAKNLFSTFTRRYKTNSSVLFGNLPLW